MIAVNGSPDESEITQENNGSVIETVIQSTSNGSKPIPDKNTKSKKSSPQKA